MAAGETTRGVHFGHALLPQGWARDVRLTMLAGRIAAVETGAAPCPHDDRHALGLPGMDNVHSHAFQRAIAGMTQRRGPGDDSFWSWRQAMYGAALSITPDQMEAVAAQAYVEMLEAGYTRVGEFHYLHHAEDGQPYDDVAEMAARIAAAADETGIGLTLLPVLYARSGFGGAAAEPAQRRFVCDLDRYARLVDATRRVVTKLDGGAFGIAPHSLRAVTLSELAASIGLAGSAPIHIHVAEQVAEVDACLAWSGVRPVQYLLDHAPVGARWCLIHATHMTGEEARRLAATGAVVGLCPITEADLGDGVFDGPAFLGAGGRFGVGTDSNVRIALAGELRLLEYGQRLVSRARNVLAAPHGSSGRALYEGAARGGGAALGRAGTGFVVGADADFMTLSGDAVENASAGEVNAVLDHWIFARGARIDRVCVRGRTMVRDGTHVGAARIRSRFCAAMRALWPS